MHIFLSYHTPERDTALALKASLEAALQGADVFVDATHLRFGHLWQPALSKAIADADAFLILVSSEVGNWQKLEYYEARDRKAKDDAFILLPVVMPVRKSRKAALSAGEDGTNTQAIANLPGLSQFHWIETSEPSAPQSLANIVAALRSGTLPKPPEPWRLINPYRGLAALDEQDSDYFFGREHETVKVLNTIVTKPGRLITLVGNSGVGKSSLVFAGVIGALKRQRWPAEGETWPATLQDSRAWAYLTMKPGADPIAELVGAFVDLWFRDATDGMRATRRNEWCTLLRDGNAKLSDMIEATDKRLRNELGQAPPPRYFLYLDQGEELYARAPAAVRRRFSDIMVDALTAPGTRLTVMTSLRADYYGALQANAALFPLCDKIDIAPLSESALGRVLREPARSLGVKFESEDLVDHVIRSAEDQPGALPLLADLFVDLWERMRTRGDGVLRISDRREIIQVGAALAGRADLFLARHPADVEAVRRLFTLRLAHVPRQGEPVRSRMERPMTEGATAEWDLVERLAGPDWRLLVTGEKDGKATAEVAHEVLLRTWPTLKRWLEDQRDFLVWRSELDARRKDYEAAAASGARASRDALLMGLSLTTADAWLKKRHDDIDQPSRDFIDTSLRADRRVARTWRYLQGAIGLLLVATIVGLVAWTNQKYISETSYWFAHFRGRETARQDEPLLTHGVVFRECDSQTNCPEMVVLPAGDFPMGSAEDEGEAEERPLRRIRVARFAVSKYEVTFDQWAACAGAGGCKALPSPGDAGWGRDDRPVINVSWDDAKEYVAWLSAMTGAEYRLLSEAEWEYAARGVTTAEAPRTRWGFGDDEAQLRDHAWYDTNSEGKTHPVGQKLANGFGLHDMHGNVWEWVEDCYAAYDPAKRDASPVTLGDCSFRVLRGGSWNSNSGNLRSAYRNWSLPTFRNIGIGFRVARTLSRPGP